MNIKTNFDCENCHSFYRKIFEQLSISSTFYECILRRYFSTKMVDDLPVSFTLLGSVLAKAARKKFVNLTVEVHRCQWSY